MRFIIQDVRAEVLPDNSASLGGPDPERQASYGTAWTWVGVRAAANILIELDDGRVGFMDIQTPGQYAIPSDDTAQLEKAKAEELALARNIIEELQVNESTCHYTGQACRTTCRMWDDEKGCLRVREARAVEYATSTVV